MLVQNQKLFEEASFAKELPFATAVELKNLAGEVTKRSLHNAFEKELQATHEMLNFKNGGYASNISSFEDGLDLVKEAIGRTGYDDKDSN